MNRMTHFFASTKEKSADGIYLNFQRCTWRELRRSGQKACKRKLGQQPRTATRSLDHPSHDEATQLACSSGHPIWQAMHKGPLRTRRGNSATNCPTTWVHISGVGEPVGNVFGGVAAVQVDEEEERLRLSPPSSTRCARPGSATAGCGALLPYPTGGASHVADLAALVAGRR